MLIQAFITKAPVNRVDVGVLIGFSSLNQEQAQRTGAYADHLKRFALTQTAGRHVAHQIARGSALTNFSQSLAGKAERYSNRGRRRLLSEGPLTLPSASFESAYNRQPTEWASTSDAACLNKTNALDLT